MNTTTTNSSPLPPFSPRAVLHTLVEQHVRRQIEGAVPPGPQRTRLIAELTNAARIEAEIDHLVEKPAPAVEVPFTFGFSAGAVPAHYPHG